MFVPTRFLPDRGDPFQDPAWRWRRCGYLLDHGRPPCRTRDDDATRRAWRFRRSLADCHTDADRGQLALDFPDLAEAHAVYTGEPLRRWELEARLLGGDPDEAVAARCGLSAAGVGAFHATFYEVRPRLHAAAYVVTVLIGEKAQHGLTADDHEPLLKIFGHGLGGAGVDAVLDLIREPPAVPMSLGDLDLPALNKLLGKLDTKVKVLLLTTPASAARPATWQRLAERYARSRREASGDTHEAVRVSAEGLLEVIAALSGGEPAKGSAAEAAA